MVQNIGNFEPNTLHKSP